MPPNEPKGTLGVFTVGMGAVATTLMAGVELVRRGARPAVGSLTQLGTLPVRGAQERIADALPLAPLPSLRFGAAELIEETALDAARNAGVLSKEDLAEVSGALGAIRAQPGIFDPSFLGKFDARRVRPERGKAAQAEALERMFRDFAGGGRAVVLLTLSTEAWRPLGPVHASPEAFLEGLRRDDPGISPSQIYAWAAVEAGLPVVNCTPNQAVEAQAIHLRARERRVPLAGSDLKSGQTLMKTVVASGLAARLLGVRGWYSTNILGNRDGQVLNAPENFKAKEITKTGVLAEILDASSHPELYGSLEHQVHINYFPPKGDNKEAWDAIQLFGWLGYEMELKINFECRDSILAAPLVLDLALLADLAAQRGECGVQTWLAGFFKCPAAPGGGKPAPGLHEQMALIFSKLQGWL
ncbi:MAG TPA: inositol-3-phosphate synthase [Opitutaceae bacterium]|jgi:myo-inositol-1-phosphate synthase